MHPKPQLMALWSVALLLAAQSVWADWAPDPRQEPQCPEWAEPGDSCHGSGECVMYSCEDAGMRPDGSRKQWCLWCSTYKNSSDDDDDGRWGFCGCTQTARTAGPWILAGSVSVILISVRRRSKP